MGLDLTVPSQSDPLVRGAATAIGGPVGRHARLGAARFWNPVRVLVALTMLTFGLGFAVKAPCRTHAWAHEYQYTRLCYSDVFALYFSEGLNQRQVPYVDHAVEYPVVIGGLMWGAGALADNASDFFDITALFLLVFAVIAVYTTAHLAGRRRPWDAALVALAPGLLLHGTTNWDLAAVAFAGLGMLAWARRQPVLAGVAFGLGVTTKLYPILFLAPLLALCVRSRRTSEWFQTAATTIGTAVIAYVPAIVFSHSFATDGCGSGQAREAAWLRFFSLNRCRIADWDSLHFAVQKLMGNVRGGDWSIPTDVLNLVVAGSVIAVVAGVMALALLAPRRPRVAQLFFLTLAGFLLVNKVNSPQYTLWLIPLAVLARPRWGAFLTWQLAEVLVLFTRFYYFISLGDAGKGIGVNWFLAAVLIRDAALVVLMALVVREVLHPAEDVVRRDGEDDPAGGVLDGALDRRDLAAAGLNVRIGHRRPRPAGGGAPA